MRRGLEDNSGVLVVRSRHGVWSVSFNCFVVVVGLGMSLLGAVGLLGLIDLPIPLLVFLAGPISALGGVLGLTTRFEIDLNGVTCVDIIWGRRRIAWTDVREVNFHTNYFNSYSVTLFPHDKNTKRLMLDLSSVQNGHELARAILEAAATANPNVRFTGGHHYGPPPYGVFPEASLGPRQDA